MPRAPLSGRLTPVVSWRNTTIPRGVLIRALSYGAMQRENERECEMGEFNSTESAQSVLMAVRALAEENARGSLVGSVEGRPLFAGQVERFIELFRKKNGLAEADAWNAWCRETGNSYGGVYDDTVDYLVNFMVMGALAEREGISVSDEEVQGQIDAAYEELSLIDVLTELAMQGLSMPDYREGLRSYMSQLRLKESVATTSDEFDAWYRRQLGSLDIVVKGLPWRNEEARARS